VCNPSQSEGSPLSGSKLTVRGVVEQVSFYLEWESKEAMDDESGDDDGPARVKSNENE